MPANFMTSSCLLKPQGVAGFGEAPEYVFELEEEAGIDILGIKVSPVLAIAGGALVGLLVLNIFRKG